PVRQVGGPHPGAVSTAGRAGVYWRRARSPPHLFSLPAGSPPVLLTCPTCQTGLQVPDGTTAMVRCPTCKTIFSPADSPAPPAVEPAPAEPPADSGSPARPEAPRRTKKRVDAEADDRPGRKPRPRDEDKD